MLEIKRFSEENELDWEEYLDKSDKASLFHTIEWKHVIEDTYKFKSFYFLVYNGSKVEGVCCAFLIKSFISGTKITTAPYNFYNEPLFDSSKAEEMIYKELKKIAKEQNALIIEIKSRYEFNEESVKRFQLVKREIYERTLIPIADEEIMKKNRKRLAKRMILKCEEAGLVSELSTNKNDLKEFHKIMVKLYSKKHLTIYQPYRLLENYEKYLMSKKEMYLLVGKLNNKIVGGTLLFSYKNKLFDQWSLSDIGSKEISPNYHLIWNALLFGYKQDKVELDLGYTSPNDKGLATFKSRWGGRNEQIIFYYFKLKKNARIPNIEYNDSFKTIRKLLKYVPGFMMNILSKILIKHFA